MKEEIREYYNAYYEKRVSIRAPKTYQVFPHYLGMEGGASGRLLDVSCGAGGLQQCATKRLSTFGLDISEKAIQLALLTTTLMPITSTYQFVFICQNRPSGQATGS